MTLAFVFDSVGFGEWFVLLAVVLIVVGPRRLPSAARTLGQYYSKFRRAADNFKRQLMDMDTEFDRAAREVERTVDDGANASSGASSTESAAYPGHEADSAAGTGGQA